MSEVQQTESRSLVKLVGDFQALEQLLLEQEGELNETLEQWMDINQGDLALKIDGYKLFIDHCEAKADYFKDRAAEFSAAAKALLGHKDRMKEYLKFSMLQMEKEELAGVDFKFKLINSKASIEIFDESLLPASFMRETVTLSADKEMIRAALDSGEQVAGVKMIENKHVRSFINSGTTKPAKKKEKKNDK